MFNEQQKEAYRKIQAPEALRARVTDQKAEQRIRLHPAAVSAVAACLIMVVALGFFLRSGEPRVVLNGQPLEDRIVFYDISPAMDVRTSPVFSVPVELELERKAEITVSHGCMILNKESAGTQLTAEGSVTVWWEIERGEVMPLCEMEIRDSKGITLITLEYNNAEITATKRRK